MNTVDQPLWSQGIWKDIWVSLQEPEAVFAICRIPIHKVLTPVGNQEANALAQYKL